MLVKIDLIHLPEIEAENLRHTPATAEQEAALRASIGALGQLQPILVRPDPGGGYVVIAGRRRLAAMRDLAFDAIDVRVDPAHDLDGAYVIAMQGAENMVRAGMDPVDQWLAVHALIERGMTLHQAGGALGLDERRARRLHLLSRLASPILDSLRGAPLPPPRDLGIVAGAPQEQQLRAFADTSHVHPDLRWRNMASLCAAARIPRDRAIFDVATADVPFEEDLFAEPGSPEHFTTTDVAGFMAAQRAAVQVLIDAGPEPAVLGEQGEYYGSWKMPKGWRQSNDAYLFVDGKKRLGKRSDRRRLYAICPPPGHGAGKVTSTIIEPVAEVAADSSRKASGGAAPEQGLAITRRGLELIAEARTEALRTALVRNHVATSPTDLLALMVLAFCARNVSVRVGGRSERFDDLAAELLLPGGQLAVLDQDRVTRIAARAMARALSITAPHQQGWHESGSGAAAEWIGAALGADGHMPRLDTAPMLATVGGRTLKEIAVAAGITGFEQAKVLRERLQGRAGKWNPLPFGAPAPKPASREGDGQPESAAAAEPATEPRDRHREMVEGWRWAENGFGVQDGLFCDVEKTPGEAAFGFGHGLYLAAWRAATPMRVAAE